MELVSILYKTNLYCKVQKGKGKHRLLKFQKKDVLQYVNRTQWIANKNNQNVSGAVEMAQELKSLAGLNFTLTIFPEPTWHLRTICKCCTRGSIVFL